MGRYLYRSVRDGDIEVEADNGVDALRKAHRICREAYMDPARLLTWDADYWVEEGLGDPDDYAIERRRP